MLVLTETIHILIQVKLLTNIILCTVCIQCSRVLSTDIKQLINERVQTEYQIQPQWIIYICRHLSVIEVQQEIKATAARRALKHECLKLI